MATQAHLVELERKHRALDVEIVEEMTHPSSDTLRLAELKRRKLRMKETIARLRNGGELH